MTMLSFRVDADEAHAARVWAGRLGVRTSELLRDALHRRLVELESEQDARRWTEAPLSDDESALSAIAAWGPAEDWSDWADAPG